MKTMCVLVVVLCATVALTVAAQDVPKQMTSGIKRDCDPMISPDGNVLAFSSNRTGNFDIFVFDYKNQGTYQLTQSAEDDRYPNWTPDSKRIVFDSRRTGEGDIYEVASDGNSGFLQLTTDKKLEEYPSYNPKKPEMLAYARRVKWAVPHPKMEVVLQEKTGGGVTVQVLAEGDQPRFSADGKKITFVSRRTKNNDVWMMNADGTVQTQLTSDPKDDKDPCFSPDGKQVVFASDRTGNFDLWAMGTDGANLRQLTSGPADEMQPVWSVGGYIYYTRQIDANTSNVFRIKAP